VLSNIIISFFLVSSNKQSPDGDSVTRTQKSTNYEEVDIYDLEKGKSDDTRSNSTATKPNAKFPVSKDGACPYCHSTNVVYILLNGEEDDNKLPDLLWRLKRDGKAESRVKGKPFMTFRCCT